MILISDRDNLTVEMRTLNSNAYDATAKGRSTQIRPIAIRLKPTANIGAFLLTILTLTGCTLIDLGGIELPRCNRDECEKKTKEEKNDCRRWQCPKDGYWECEEIYKDEDGDGYKNEVCKGIVDEPLDCDDDNRSINPGADEICDKRDNDCDRVIDEGLFNPYNNGCRSIDLIDRFGVDGGCEREENFELTVASGRPSPYLAIVQKSVQEYELKNRGWLVKIDPNDPDETFQRLDYHYSTDGEEGDSKSCPGCDGKPKICNFHHLAFGIVDTNEIITASVTNFDCSFGRLRIGFADQKESLVHLDGGDSNAKSNVKYGVVAPRCEEDCDENRIRHPVIASLTANNQRQALVVWMQENSQTTRRAECGLSTEPASLRALGLWIDVSQNDLPLSLTATQDGEHTDLGQTSNYGAPSLTTWRLDDSNSGYLLAYSNLANRNDVSKNLEFTLIPALPNTIDKNADLPKVFHCPINDLGDPIEHVALAIGAHEKNSKRLPLLAAYRTGCNEESRIRLALFEFDTTDYTRCTALKLVFSDDLSVSKNGETIVDGPVVAYSDSDFYLPSGSKRNESIGGWTVVWTERGNEGYRLLASRVSGLKDEKRILILDKEPMTLATRKGVLTSPVTFIDPDGNILFGAIDHCEGQPIWGRTYCNQ